MPPAIPSTMAVRKHFRPDTQAYGEHPIVRERRRTYSRTMKTKLVTFLSRSNPVHMGRQFTAAVAFCGTLGLLAGCASEPESHVVSAPPPPTPTRSVTTTTTTTTPDTMPVMLVGNSANGVVTTTTPAVSTTIVTVAPP